MASAPSAEQLHLPALEAVDERAQQGYDHTELSADHSLQHEAWVGADVPEQSHPIEQVHHSEMGKSFALALRGADAQQGRHDSGVGEEDHGKCQKPQ